MYDEDWFPSNFCPRLCLECGEPVATGFALWCTESLIDTR